MWQDQNFKFVLGSCTLPWILDVGNSRQFLAKDNWYELQGILVTSEYWNWVLKWEERTSNQGLVIAGIRSKFSGVVGHGSAELVENEGRGCIYTPNMKQKIQAQGAECICQDRYGGRSEGP